MHCLRCFLIFISRISFIAPAFLIPFSWAGNYSVSPLSLQFSPQTKSAVITITNEDKKNLTLRTRPMRWTQDANGEDIYKETDDLVIFPRRLEMKPSDKKIIRAGINELNEEGEKAYRLYLQEIAPPQEPGQNLTRLSVLVDVGVPIFVSKGDVKQNATITQIAAQSPNSITLRIANLGTGHIRINQITTKEDKVFVENPPVRYVFPGVTRAFSIPIPASFCSEKKATLKFDTNQTPIYADVALPGSCH